MGVAQGLARRPAVRQALVRFPAGLHPWQIIATQTSADEKNES
jgi:hypothetical protein